MTARGSRVPGEDPPAEGVARPGHRPAARTRPDQEEIMTTDDMRSVDAADGTPIGYWTSGQGPPLVLVHGGTADHHRWDSVRPLLEPRLALYAMDRRGRGGSGDHPDYAIEREFEDVAAVVRAVADRTGGPVDLLAHSFGALCALGAAGRLGAELRRLVIYEPPIGPAGVILGADLVDRLEALLAQDRRDEALRLFFLEEVQVPPAELEVLRGLPAWRARVAAVHTIPRELRAVEALDPTPGFFHAVTAPTLLLLGGDSPTIMAEGIGLVHRHLPTARLEVLPGQQHLAMDTAPDLFCRLVTGFLTDPDT
jgi:pimeloyl-ACP methyl ester carboxylesterase